MNFTIKQLHGTNLWTVIDANGSPITFFGNGMIAVGKEQAQAIADVCNEALK